MEQLSRRKCLEIRITKVFPKITKQRGTKDPKLDFPKTRVKYLVPIGKPPNLNYSYFPRIEIKDVTA